jgi:hypothetical protein
MTVMPLAFIVILMEIIKRYSYYKPSGFAIYTACGKKKMQNKEVHALKHATYI